MIPNGSIPTTSQRAVPPPAIKILSGKAKKAPKVMALENKNWLIYFHYTRREFGICNILIKEELAKTNGMNEFANYIQGVILRHEGKIQESLEYFQKCHILNPKNVDNIKQVARSLSLLGCQKLSVDALQEAKNVSQNPDWSVYHNLGLCYYNLGDHGKAKEAVEVYTAALEISPDSVDLATSLGLLYMKLGDNQKAFEQFGSALAHRPDCPGALLATGLMMQNHKEYDVALSKYKSASVIIPESAPLWNNIGMCFFGKRKLVAAITCLKRANYLAPLDWKILYNLGLVHMYSQQYASAFHFLSSALNLQPKIGSGLLLLAITLSQLNDIKNATTAFDQAVAYFPEEPLVLLNRALFSYKQGEISKATEDYKKFQVVAQRIRGLDNNVLKMASTLRQLLNVGGSGTEENFDERRSKATQKTDPELPSTSQTTQNQRPATLEIDDVKPEDDSSKATENPARDELVSEEVIKAVSVSHGKTK